MKIQWVCKTFDALTPHELYAVMRLRSEVFVMEQHCVFLDADNMDAACMHLMGMGHSFLAAYARLVPAGVAYAEASIGRVVTAPRARKEGLGKALMQQAITECYQRFGYAAIRIGAQLYLKKFYESFGFLAAGDIYDEDGINHIPMLLLPPSDGYI